MDVAPGTSVVWRKGNRNRGFEESSGFFDPVMDGTANRDDQLFAYQGTDTDPTYFKWFIRTPGDPTMSSVRSFWRAGTFSAVEPGLICSTIYCFAVFGEKSLYLKLYFTWRVRSLIATDWIR